MASKRVVGTFPQTGPMEGPGRKEPVSDHGTQVNAERAGKRDLARAGGGEVRIRDRRGCIRDSDTLPQAKDPKPPKDRRH